MKTNHSFWTLKKQTFLKTIFFQNDCFQKSENDSSLVINIQVEGVIHTTTITSLQHRVAKIYRLKNQFLFIIFKITILRKWKNEILSFSFIFANYDAFSTTNFAKFTQILNEFHENFERILRKFWTNLTNFAKFIKENFCFCSHFRWLNEHFKPYFSDVFSIGIEILFRSGKVSKCDENIFPAGWRCYASVWRHFRQIFCSCSPLDSEYWCEYNCQEELYSGGKKTV